MTEQQTLDAIVETGSSSGQDKHQHTTSTAPLIAVGYVNTESVEQLRPDIDTVLSYMRGELGIDWITRDAIDEITANIAADSSYARVATDDAAVRVVIDSDGERGEWVGLMQDLFDAPDVRGVVTPAADHVVGESREAEEIQSVVQAHGLQLHLVDQGVTIRRDTEFSEALLKSLSVLADLSSVSDIELNRPDPTGGRPPLGYTSVDGRRVPGEDYDVVCTVLKRVDAGDESIRGAARRLDCERQTIRNALDHLDRYDLD